MNIGISLWIVGGWSMNIDLFVCRLQTALILEKRWWININRLCNNQSKLYQSFWALHTVQIFDQVSISCLVTHERLMSHAYINIGISLWVQYYGTEQFCNVHAIDVMSGGTETYEYCCFLTWSSCIFSTGYGRNCLCGCELNNLSRRYVVSTFVAITLLLGLLFVVWHITIWNLTLPHSWVTPIHYDCLSYFPSTWCKHPDTYCLVHLRMEIGIQQMLILKR